MAADFLAIQWARASGAMLGTDIPDLHNSHNVQASAPAVLKSSDSFKAFPMQCST